MVCVFRDSAVGTGDEGVQECVMGRAGNGVGAGGANCAKKQVYRRQVSCTLGSGNAGLSDRQWDTRQQNSDMFPVNQTS